MKRVNTYGFFTLAKNLQPLEAFVQGVTYGELMLPMANARYHVGLLLNAGIVDLRICRHAANQLVAAINVLVPVDLSIAFGPEKDKDEVPYWYLVNNVKEAATKFETVLAEELGVMDTYSVSQKGAYSTPELINNAEAVIPAALRGKLPVKAIDDIREAGKCLAFEAPTAAGFHLLRAVEACLLQYYAQVMGASRPARMRNWGVYISSMRKAGTADTKILSFLDHIREDYRNPITHPEQTLTVDQVLVLFGVAAAAIVQIATALE